MAEGSEVPFYKVKGQAVVFYSRFILTLARCETHNIIVSSIIALCSYFCSTLIR